MLFRLTIVFTKVLVQNKLKTKTKQHENNHYKFQ
jgi:hypothetical protein